VGGLPVFSGTETQEHSPLALSRDTAHDQRDDTQATSHKDIVCGVLCEVRTSKTGAKCDAADEWPTSVSVMGNNYYNLATGCF
jgi:hypothetical protein